MLTECIRSEDCCMLDNYYVNEAALCIEHKVPPPTAPYNSGNWRAALTLPDPLLSVVYNEMFVCIGSLGQEHYSQSKD